MAFWNRRKAKEKQKEQAVFAPANGSPHAPAGSLATWGKKRKLVPVEVKLLAMEALEAGLTHAEVCELLGVGISTVSHWRKLYAEGGERALMKQASSPGASRICNELQRRIEQMRRDNPEAGVRKIRDELRRDDAIEVSAETVRRVVNDAGLGNPPVTPHPRPAQLRRFERELPNAMWQIDIFTFQLKKMYPVYLVGMIDDHSRYIVGHGLYRQQTAEAVLEVVKGAIGQWGAPREILSDNGRQFAAWRGETRFQKVLKQQGVSHVRSAPHHPMTLGKIERFWKTIWTEFLEDAVFASFADARQRLDHWIGYYNHQRPHQGIDGACPADRFYGVASDVEEAVKQGCKENALQLALGQETRPPLYLLGKLGETDVRVVRKGEDIEVRLGDEIHEVIRIGSPFRVDESGHYEREGTADELAGDERSGALPGGGTGPEGRGADQRTVPDVWGEPSDLEPGGGEGGGGGDGRAGAEAPWAEGQVRGGGGAGLGEEGAVGSAARPQSLAAEVRDRHDLRGPAAEDVEWRAARRGGGVANSPQEKKAAQAPGPVESSADIWSESDWDEDGGGR